MNEQTTPSRAPRGGRPIRRLVGATMERRKITLTTEQNLELEERARKANTSVSELLVTSTLSGSALAQSEQEALMAALNALRAETADVKLLMDRAIKAAGAGSAEFAEAVEAWKALNTAAYNAVENLAIR